jgi:hypothetical protein
VEAPRTLPPEMLDGIDFNIIRLVIHEPGDVFRGCGPDILPKCKWFNSRQENRDNAGEDAAAEGIF